MLFSMITQSLIRGFYTVAIAISIPVALLRLWWKGRRNPGYRERWTERFGFLKAPIQTGGIWVHVVSVGEAMAAVPLIRALQAQFPDQPITITSTTPTGFERVRDVFQGKVFQSYFPYDLPGNFKRFLNTVRPRILIIMETELWLNCFCVCREAGIPVLIVNGRLSPQSMQGYKYIGMITRQILDCITQVMAQSERDGTRFVELGLAPDRLLVTGNMKFDVALKEGIEEEGKLLRASWGTRPVWIAASTHAEEEEIILEAFREIQKHYPRLLLILVPRHSERFDSVAALLEQQGYSVVRRSTQLPVSAETEVFLGDTMGELSLFYAASDIAFVGGSFVPVGGHNTLEAAALSVPTIVGPYVHNFVEITELLSTAGALVQTPNVQSLVQSVLHYLGDVPARQRAGVAGKAVVEKNRGAVKKMIMALIRVYF
jgi:3-deoxy-D-manno-octulosonic-acid transferase